MQITNQSNVTYNSVIGDEKSAPVRLASNTVNTDILSDAITKVLVADKTFAREGETVHNTVTITNNSNVKLFSTFISAITPVGASNVADSVKVNGVSQPTKDMYSGFYLPELNPGETITVEYDLKVDNPMTTTPINVSPQFQYWVKDPSKGDIRFVENTNTVAINVISDKLTVVKSVDKAFAAKGETLTYTVTITNKGNVDINDIFFTDSIPQGTAFVENSVFINGNNVTGYRPDAGYSLANLKPDESATTSFKVTVD